MATQIPAGFRLRVPVQFLDNTGKPEPVQNPGVTSSDATVATGAFDTNGDLLVTRVGVGAATLTIQADADVSEAIALISNTFDVTCPPVQADHITFGNATLEADPAIPAPAQAAAAAAAGAASGGAPASGAPKTF